VFFEGKSIDGMYGYHLISLLTKFVLILMDVMIVRTMRMFIASEKSFKRFVPSHEGGKGLESTSIDGRLILK
jgi:hypothetical protein